MDELLADEKGIKSIIIDYIRKNKKTLAPVATGVIAAGAIIGAVYKQSQDDGASQPISSIDKNMTDNEWNDLNDSMDNADYPTHTLAATEAEDAVTLGNITYWNNAKNIVPYGNHTQIVDEITEKSGKDANTSADIYNIDANSTLILESGHTANILYQNYNLTKGPTGLLIEVAPGDRKLTEGGNIAQTILSNITLDSAVDRSYTEAEKLAHILDDSNKFDEHSITAGMISTTETESTVYKNAINSKNGYTYILVGIENEGGIKDTRLVSGNPWDQIEEIKDRFTTIFPKKSRGSSSENGDDSSSGGGRDGGDEY